MEIYAIFNTETGVYQAALIQGAEEDGGSFDTFGDERFEQASQVTKIFQNSSDWILISEEDFEKYRLRTHGGDNDTGYVYDFKTKKAVSAPPRPFDVQIANIQSKYSSQYNDLKKDFLDALLINAGTSQIQARYDEIVEKSNAEFINTVNKGGE